MNEPAAASRRLEALWQGDFGREYTDRNRDSREARRQFWYQVLTNHPADSVLEVGCNRGLNLEWVVALVSGPVTGVDISDYALEHLRRALPRVRAVRATGSALPFASGAFDLVFTVGVLIHVEPVRLYGVMSEVVRCARRWILCGEYFAESPTEVRYRGQPGLLFKQDYGARYQEAFPGLALRARGHLTRADGFDDVTWWVFEKLEEHR